MATIALLVDPERPRRLDLGARGEVPPEPVPAEGARRRRRDHERPGPRRDRRLARLRGDRLPLLPLHAARAADARLGRRARDEPAARDPGQPDAERRLGPRGDAERGLRDDGRAARVQLDPNFMLLILTYSFAAAVLGGIDSPVGSVVGAFLIGIGISLLSGYASVVPRHRAAAAGRARRPPARPDRPAGRPVRPGRREEGLDAACRRRTSCCARAVLVAVPLLVVFLPKAFNDYFNYRLAFVGIYFIAIVGLNVAHRLQRPDLARPRRVHGLRRLHDGDPERRTTASASTGRSRSPGS